jgi:hypothetical protein
MATPSAMKKNPAAIIRDYPPPSVTHVFFQQHKSAARHRRGQGDELAEGIVQPADGTLK